MASWRHSRRSQRQSALRPAEPLRRPPGTCCSTPASSPAQSTGPAAPARSPLTPVVRRIRAPGRCGSVATGATTTETESQSVTIPSAAAAPGAVVLDPHGYCRVRHHGVRHDEGPGRLRFHHDHLVTYSNVGTKCHVLAEVVQPGGLQRPDDHREVFPMSEDSSLQTSAVVRRHRRHDRLSWEQASSLRAGRQRCGWRPAFTPSGVLTDPEGSGGRAHAGCGLRRR